MPVIIKGKKEGENVWEASDAPDVSLSTRGGKMIKPHRRQDKSDSKHRFVHYYHIVGKRGRHKGQTVSIILYIDFFFQDVQMTQRYRITLFLSLRGKFKRYAVVMGKVSEKEVSIMSFYLRYIDGETIFLYI